MKSFTKLTSFKIIALALLTPAFFASSCKSCFLMMDDVVSRMVRRSSLPHVFYTTENSTRKTFSTIKMKKQYTPSYNFLRKRAAYQNYEETYSSNLFENVLTSSIIWGGLVTLSLSLNILGDFHSHCMGIEFFQKDAREDFKLLSYWNIPRDGYRPRIEQEKLEHLIDKLKEKEGVKVIVLGGPMGSGKTVLSNDAVWKIRNKGQFLGHFFYFTSDEESLKKQIIAFAQNLGMPSTEARDYDNARRFIEEKLKKPGAKDFVLIFEKAKKGDDIRKFIFNGPNLRGIQIITTLDEQFEDNEKWVNDYQEWGWTYFPLEGLKKEEAIEFFISGLNNDKKSDIDRESAEKIIETIENTYPLTLVDLITQINRDEITIEDLTLRYQQQRQENTIKLGIGNKTSEIKNILYLISNISSRDIPIELIDMMVDPSGKIDSVLTMNELTRSHILRNVRSGIYEIHPIYQEISMQVYLEEVRKTSSILMIPGYALGAITGMFMGRCLGRGVFLGRNLVIGKLRGENLLRMVTGTALEEIEGALMGTIIGAAVGSSIVEKITAKDDNELKKEILKKISKNIIQGCHGKEDKCISFLHHLKVIKGNCSRLSMDVSGIESLINRLEKVDNSGE